MAAIVVLIALGGPAILVQLGHMKLLGALIMGGALIAALNSLRTAYDPADLRTRGSNASCRAGAYVVAAAGSRCGPSCAPARWNFGACIVSAEVALVFDPHRDRGAARAFREGAIDAQASSPAPAATSAARWSANCSRTAITWRVWRAATPARRSCVDSAPRSFTADSTRSTSSSWRRANTTPPSTPRSSAAPGFVEAERQALDALLHGRALRTHVRLDQRLVGVRQPRRRIDR